ncbi:MAG: MFS transporter [Chloroflexi bacterium]|nr:MFS transporter [Chloroflexota bacterium]
MTARVRARWNGLTAATWWPVVPLLLVQTLSGIVYMPQITFFPIYLEERLGFATVTISALVSGGQIAGMIAGTIAGFLSDVLGGKWMLVLGLLGMTLTSVQIDASHGNSGTPTPMSQES